MKPRQHPRPKTSNVDVARNMVRELLDIVAALDPHRAERFVTLSVAAGHTWIRPAQAYVTEGQEDMPMPPAEIARLLHVAETTVRNWKARDQMRAYTWREALRCKAERDQAARGAKGRTA